MNEILFCWKCGRLIGNYIYQLNENWSGIINYKCPSCNRTTSTEIFLDKEIDDNGKIIYSNWFFRILTDFNITDYHIVEITEFELQLFLRNPQFINVPEDAPPFVPNDASRALQFLKVPEAVPPPAKP